MIVINPEACNKKISEVLAQHLSIEETAAALSDSCILHLGFLNGKRINDPKNTRERERAVLLFLINSVDTAIFFPCEYPKNCQKKTRCADMLAMLRSAYDHLPELKR